MKNLQKALIPACLLLCALCEMGCASPSTQRQMTPPGAVVAGPAGGACAGMPRITSAEASNEFTDLKRPLPSSKEFQISVRGDGFAPGKKVFLAVTPGWHVPVAVIADTLGGLAWTAVGTEPCGTEMTVTAQDTNGLQSNTVAVRWYCL